MPDYDLIIIGAGPAGSTLARLAPGHLRIAVVDKIGLPGEHPKPCGGLLSPDAQKFLARSELTLPKEILVTPQIFAVKTIDFSLKKRTCYQRSYLNMDRALFDDWLRSLIPDRVDKINARCTRVEKKDGVFNVVLRDGDGYRTITSSLLVGADGANSVVRKQFFPNRPIRRYVAIQRWFADNNTTPFYSCIFDKHTSDCCSWSISKDDHMIYGGAFAPKNCRKDFTDQLDTAAKKGFSFGKAEFDEACLVARPKRVKEIISGGDGVMLLGEAGGFISPSSLEGISWAMRCGEYAATALLSDDPVKKYSKLCKKLKSKLGLKLLKCPFMYDPFLRKIVINSGIKSLKHI